MNRISLFFALIIAVAIAGCGKPNPLGPDDSSGGGGGRDTIIVITPPDTTHDHCPTCPPCPPDTTDTPPPPGSTKQYATAGGRIHEAQSHATLVSGVTIGSPNDQATLVLAIEYENKPSQHNENFHVYFRDVTTFAVKYDMTFPPTGTEVVPDESALTGWLDRRLTITGLPRGTYLVEIQQDLPNHHAPGESDIRFRAGTLTVEY